MNLKKMSQLLDEKSDLETKLKNKNLAQIESDRLKNELLQIEYKIARIHSGDSNWNALIFIIICFVSVILTMLVGGY